ncbi:hypothetical protein [Robbsia andropogonis]|uniref:hypothetical protein n=1 Tax=Robbsia andropogonis TaxID=28092 RepID=UPI0004661B9A|nr:hypothetical protein [Robbsia andropogonis]
MTTETEVLHDAEAPAEESNAPVLFEDDDAEDAQPEQDVSAEESAEDAEATSDAEPPEEDLQTKETKRFSEMRKTLNGTLKDKKRLERELEEMRTRYAPPKPTLGPKPTLDQFDYDENRFSAAYDEWAEQKRAVEAEERNKQEAERKEQEALEAHKRAYSERARSLGVSDFSEAEQEIRDVLNPVQIGLLMKGADDPASLVYALGKSSSRLFEASKITDPVKFTVHIARLETALAAKRTAKPAPEPRVTSERAATGFSASSNTLDRLREEAARTGDYTKVTAYKRQNNVR